MAKSTKPEKPALSLPGTVEKIIPGNAIATEKAQISVEDAEHLYKEIRVENTLEDADGNKVKLKPGAHVEVTIEAEKDATEPKRNVVKEGS